MANASTSGSSQVPQSRNSRHQASNAPGTTAGKTPVAGIRSMSRPRNFSSVAVCGAGPCPQTTCCVCVRAECSMIGASPPGPLRCGSATWSMNAVAAAASKAFPPRSSTAMPAWLAIQWVLATTPNVPAISGRVVNMQSSPLPGVRANVAAMQLASKTYDVADIPAIQELSHSNGWTDGLPIVPPTQDAVGACLDWAMMPPDQ